MVISNISI
ncbi:UNVERIFIED_CONTAM: hypothetical protein GTU68_042449 [Idotea baltica]|nr:hypothetical protein [Idotea baltica]